MPVAVTPAFETRVWSTMNDEAVDVPPASARPSGRSAAVAVAVLSVAAALTATAPYVWPAPSTATAACVPGAGRAGRDGQHGEGGEQRRPYGERQRRAKCAPTFRQRLSPAAAHDLRRV